LSCAFAGDRHEVESDAGLIAQDPRVVTGRDDESIAWTEIHLHPVFCTDTHPA